MGRNKYLRTKSGVYLVLANQGDGDCTQAQMRDFKRWARREGFIFARGYSRESAKSCWVATGTGRFAGATSGKVSGLPGMRQVRHPVKGKM